MAMWATLKGKLSGKKSLDKVSRDELRVEKIRLDQAQAKIIQKVDKLEAGKKDLMEQGMKESSQRKQVIIARRIKELDTEGSHFDRQLQAISHHVRIIGGLIKFKDEMGIMSKESNRLVSQIPLEDLAAFVEKATVQDEFQQEKLNDVLATLEEGRGVLTEPMADEEEDVRQIVSLFQQVRASAETDPELALDSSMERMDRILHKEDPAED